MRVPAARTNPSARYRRLLGAVVLGLGSAARYRRLLGAVVLGLGTVSAPLLTAGPIEVLREGDRFCPRDRELHAPPLTEAKAIERARTLLPSDFCGPTTFVSGCDVVPEYSLGSWRIYFHQYQLRGGRRDWSGLTHTYIVLDAVGNCYANIPGTEQGAPR